MGRLRYEIALALYILIKTNRVSVDAVKDYYKKRRLNEMGGLDLLAAIDLDGAELNRFLGITERIEVVPSTVAVDVRRVVKSAIVRAKRTDFASELGSLISRIFSLPSSSSPASEGRTGEGGARMGASRGGGAGGAGGGGAGGGAGGGGGEGGNGESEVGEREKSIYKFLIQQMPMNIREIVEEGDEIIAEILQGRVLDVFDFPSGDEYIMATKLLKFLSYARKKVFVATGKREAQVFSETEIFVKDNYYGIQPEIFLRLRKLRSVLNSKLVEFQSRGLQPKAVFRSKLITTDPVVFLALEYDSYTQDESPPSALTVEIREILGRKLVPIKVKQLVGQARAALLLLFDRKNNFSVNEVADEIAADGGAKFNIVVFYKLQSAQMVEEFRQTELELKLPLNALAKQLVETTLRYNTLDELQRALLVDSIDLPNPKKYVQMLRKDLRRSLSINQQRILRNRDLAECCVQECTNTSAFSCSRCFSRYYCSRDCQKQDFPSHREECEAFVSSPGAVKEAERWTSSSYHDLKIEEVTLDADGNNKAIFSGIPGDEVIPVEKKNLKEVPSARGPSAGGRPEGGGGNRGGGLNGGEQTFYVFE